jgi:hypothetical protein
MVSYRRLGRSPSASSCGYDESQYAPSNRRANETAADSKDTSPGWIQACFPIGMGQHFDRTKRLSLLFYYDSNENLTLL